MDKLKTLRDFAEASSKYATVMGDKSLAATIREYEGRSLGGKLMGKIATIIDGCDRDLMDYIAAIHEQKYRNYPILRGSLKAHRNGLKQ